MESRGDLALQGPGFEDFLRGDFGRSLRPAVAPAFHHGATPPGFGGNGLISRPLGCPEDNRGALFQMQRRMRAFGPGFENGPHLVSQLNAGRDGSCQAGSHPF